MSTNETSLNIYYAALGIIDPGACNTVAIVNTLNIAAMQLHHEGKGTDYVSHNPAIKLILHQLGYLASKRELLTQDDFDTCVKLCRALANEDLRLGIPHERFVPDVTDSVVILDTLTDNEWDIYAETCALGMRKFNVKVGRIEVYEGNIAFWILDTQSDAEAEIPNPSPRIMGDMTDAYTSNLHTLIVGTAEFYDVLMNDLKDSEHTLLEAYFGIKVDEIPTKFRVDYAGASVKDTHWATNAIEYDSVEEAVVAANSKLDVWTGARGFRVVPVTQPKGELIDPKEVRTK